MNKKGLILSIFLAFIVILSSGSVFAEDISNANSDDSASSPIANDAVYGEITTSSNYTVHTGSNSSTIQNIINSMHNGDVLNFEKGEPLLGGIDFRDRLRVMDRFVEILSLSDFLLIWPQEFSKH